MVMYITLVCVCHKKRLDTTQSGKTYSYTNIKHESMPTCFLSYGSNYAHRIYSYNSVYHTFSRSHFTSKMF